MFLFGIHCYFNSVFAEIESIAVNVPTARFCRSTAHNRIVSAGAVALADLSATFFTVSNFVVIFAKFNVVKSALAVFVGDYAYYFGVFFAVRAVDNRIFGFEI